MYRITFVLFITLLTFGCKKKSKDDPSPATTASSCVYDFTKTTATYVSISSPDGYYDSQTDLGTEGAISIPFAFKVCGKAVTKFEAESGEIDFATSGSEDVSMVCGIGGSYTSWKTEGAAGNKILKIQMQDKAGSTVDCNLQVWLYENGGVIEVHYGKNTGIDPSQYGNFLIRAETATTLQGIALSGSIIDPKEEAYVGKFDSPVIYCLNNNSITDAYLINGSIPNGLTYLFTPKN